MCSVFGVLVQSVFDICGLYTASFASLQCPPPAVLSRGNSLRALDALEAAEVPAFLQTGADAGQLLSEGARQPGEKSLHLAGVDLQKYTKIRQELDDPSSCCHFNLHE